MKSPQNNSNSKNNRTKLLRGTTKNAATILIVEDDSGLRFLLEKCMSQANYQTISVADGTEALGALAENQIDLILLDLLMPHENGFTACQNIRRHYQIPILILSALSCREAQARAQQLGADGYLTKPVRLADLHFWVRSLLGKADPC